MIFIKTLLFFYIQIYRKKTINMINTLSTIYNDEENINNYTYGGYDERYPIKENKLETENCNIYKLHIKKQLLDILEDKNISIHNKLDLLYDNSIKIPTLISKNLMKDFEYDI